MIVYNDIDPYCVEWLRALVEADELPEGEVDDRSICEITTAPETFHAFAGIGGWPHALRLAGWPDDEPVWTGSCPCQPFSTAGRGRGATDERHLWPEWRRLIEECRPPILFGEQVASPAGRSWLGDVRADLEVLGYAVGAADLCAAGVGAPHARQRLYFVAHADGERLPRLGLFVQQGKSRSSGIEVVGSRGSQSLAYTESERRECWRSPFGLGDGTECRTGNGPRDDRDVGHTCGERLEGRQGEFGYLGAREGAPVERAGGLSGTVGDTDSDKGLGIARSVFGSKAKGAGEGEGTRYFSDCAEPPGTSDWFNCDWIPCRDGVSRPVEPGAQPLAHGLPRGLGRAGSRERELGRLAGRDLREAKRNRRGRLSGYGNAIVPQLAAEFIRAFVEAVNG